MAPARSATGEVFSETKPLERDARVDLIGAAITLVKVRSSPIPKGTAGRLESQGMDPEPPTQGTQRSHHNLTQTQVSKILSTDILKPRRSLHNPDATCMIRSLLPGTVHLLFEPCFPLN